MSLGALPGYDMESFRQADVDSCTVDPCPCSSGLRRSDQDQGRVSSSPGVHESETPSQQLLEPFAEDRDQERDCDLEQAGILTPLVVDAHEEQISRTSTCTSTSQRSSAYGGGRCLAFSGADMPSSPDPCLDSADASRSAVGMASSLS